MTDSKLRELERRWKETGSVEDEAAYLLERVWAGDLKQEMLELAAYCGHGAAQFASPHASLTAPNDVVLWLRGVEHWGRRPCDLAALAIGRSAEGVWERAKQTGVLRDCVAGPSR